MAPIVVAIWLLLISLFLLSKWKKGYGFRWVRMKTFWGLPTTEYYPKKVDGRWLVIPQQASRKDKTHLLVLSILAFLLSSVTGFLFIFKN